MNNFYSLINISIVTFLLTVPLSAQGTTEVTIHSYDFTNGLEGWTTVNDSEPQANAHGFSAQAWGIRSTYDSGSPVISNWVISPVIQLQAGDVIEFRIGGNNLAELRLSTSGAATADPTPNNGNATDLGDFTTLLFTGNPDINFPNDNIWHDYAIEIPAAAIPDGVTDFKIAIRHFNNTNQGNFLNLDFVNILRRNTLSTPDFNTSQHLQVYPQPALDRISLKTEYKGALHLDFFDLSGRKVKSYKNTLQRDFNVSDLRKSGRMFLVQIESASGSLIAHKKLLLR